MLPTGISAAAIRNGEIIGGTLGGVLLVAVVFCPPRQCCLFSSAMKLDEEDGGLVLSAGTMFTKYTFDS